MSKPRVLILGGIGFIGRNLVQYLLKNDLTSKIRVADKMLPALASLSEEQKDIYNNKIEFKQLNLSRANTIAKAFDDDAPFDIVINLAAETKYSQEEAVYKEYVIDVASTSGTEAAKRGVKHFVEISTAQVYEPSSKPRTEESKLKPWTSLAKAKLEAENVLKAIPNLPLTILRPALVYGPGDISSITPRLVTAAVYKYLGEKMEFLWDKDLKINTVHIDDVVTAIWHVATKVTPSGAVFNLADSSDTDQGSLCPILESIFGIKTSFIGNLKSKVYSTVAMKIVADTANDKHLKPWSEICKSHNITVTPLTPYIDEELLLNNDLCINGSAITKTGFKYAHPTLTLDLVRASLDYHIKNGSFPEISTL